MKLASWMTPRKLWELVKASFSSWIDDYAPSMGAALSYYTMFSIAPLLLIVIAVAGLAFGQEAASGEIFAQLRGLMGEEAAKAIQDMVNSVNEPGKSTVATIVGVAVALVGATTVFGELQDALDRIWRAPLRDKGGGLWKLLRARLLSFGMILGIAFLLMVSLIAGAALSALGNWWAPLFGTWEVLLQAVNFVVSFAVTVGVFGAIYKIMPRVHVEWHDVWIGAIATALLFTIGKFLIGLYIGKSGIASGYGAAGSLVVMLVWVYYSAQIFLLGAEFTWIYATTYGSMKHLKDAKSAEQATPGGIAATNDVPARSKGASGDPGVPATASASVADVPLGERTVLQKVSYAVGAALTLRLLFAAVTRSRLR